MKRILRVLAVMSSLALMAGFVSYQTYGAPKSKNVNPEPPRLLSQKPSEEATPNPEPTSTPPPTFIFSTKSGRIITPSATPTQPPERYMPSSKSTIIVQPMPEREEKPDQ